MLICHCNGVSDRTVRRAVREGAGSLNEVGSACGAGACCGGCANAVKQIIRTEVEARDEISSSPAPISASRA